MKSYKSTNRHTHQEVSPIKGQDATCLLQGQFAENEKQQPAPLFFMQKPLEYLTSYTEQVRLPYLELLMTATMKSNPAFLAIEPPY